jgi:hypothetical protein
MHLSHACTQESTRSAEMLSASRRTGETGTLLYTYDYDLDTTRGRKRIISTVAVAEGKLFILNGTMKCAGAEPGCAPLGGPEVAKVVRAAAETFDVLRAR